MKSYSHYVGIDCSKDSFAAAIFTGMKAPFEIKEKVANSTSGFVSFTRWLNKRQAQVDTTRICIEATGVYSEALCYYLTSAGYHVTLASPQKVKRAFEQTHKSDPVDAKQIAEYAYRFNDKLEDWQPRSDILEEINNLLFVREQLVKQKTALKNTQHALKRKRVQARLANKVCRENIARLDDQIKELETEMQNQINTDSNFAHIVDLLDAVPGIGLLLALNLLVETNAFTNIASYATLAAYIGVCPLMHQSGSSIRKKSKSRGRGPERIRKLLHLAARSLCGSKPKYKAYKLRKQQQGKIPKVVFNNVGNKILRIACAVIKEQKPFDPNYVSINPRLTK